MRSQYVLALAAMAVSTLASPIADLTDLASTTGGFAVEQVYVGKKFRNVPAEIVKTFEKFGKVPPSNVVKAAAARAAVQSGKVSATPIDSYDDAYACIVSVGTPAQNLPLDFDSGSSDLWVFSSLQPSSQRSGHSYYNPSSSSTSKSLGKTWNIAYGDGSGAKGTVYSDKVVIGGVSATSMSVEAATSVSSSFTSDTAISGLVGLAFDNINTCSPSACPTFMDTVGSSLPSNLFTAYLKHQAPGFYTFGYINASQYTGSITYQSVTTSNGFWEFTVTGYTVGTTGYSASYDTIADTGTTLVYMPDDLLSNYYAKVSGSKYSSGAGGYVFPCSSTLPNLSFTIGGTSHTIPGSLVNYGVYSGSTCFGGVQSSDGVGVNILGDIFLKSQFVVFDKGNTRIGFAQSK